MAIRLRPEMACCLLKFTNLMLASVVVTIPAGGVSPMTHLGKRLARAICRRKSARIRQNTERSIYGSLKEETGKKYKRRSLHMTYLGYSLSTGPHGGIF